MTHSTVEQGRSLLSRRQWLQLSAAGTMGVSLSSWLEPWAAAARRDAQRPRSCIVLWMNGGPSQMDTFDLKPGHANGGPFKEIATAVPGIKISEHLPQVAQWMKHMAIIRSMSTRDVDHGLSKYLMHTGYAKVGALAYPPLGALVAKELGRAEAVLPNGVSIAPDMDLVPEVQGAGFLDPVYGPLRLGDNSSARATQAAEQLFRVPNLNPPAENAGRGQERLELLQKVDQGFAKRYAGLASRSHQSAYERAVRLMRSEAAQAFDLEQEPAKVRDAYGLEYGDHGSRTLFGQGCLLARRLVERGVPFVEVSFTSLSVVIPWDTHDHNFGMVSQLSQILDPAWSSLMRELQERGLLETTLIVWMGEFGRTPQINGAQGRDHYAAAWSTALAGGGIRGGQVIGKTSADGMEAKERPVSAPDFLATICLALGMNPKKMNTSDTGRPISLVDENAQPIRELLA